MKITISSYDTRINYDLALGHLVVKHGVDYRCRQHTLTDDVVYDIPDDVWNLTSFQHAYLKLVLKYK